MLIPILILTIVTINLTTLRISIKNSVILTIIIIIIINNNNNNNSALINSMAALI